jgi:uncharacterized phage protein (predicted DNA packaging)
MIIQTLKDIALPGGTRVPAGAVLSVPDATGAALIEQGAARLRVQPGPVEKKGGKLNPGDPLPPEVPYVRVPTDAPVLPLGLAGYQDQNNFVTNQVTVRAFDTSVGTWDWANQQDTTPPPPVAPSDSASSRPPVLTLDLIKQQCKIESDQTVDDELLQQYEMAARLHTENYLRYQIDDTMGENIKQACLMLIAHWYRNREAVTTGKTSVGVEMPLAYMTLLSGERDYPIY